MISIVAGRIKNTWQVSGCKFADMLVLCSSKIFFCIIYENYGIFSSCKSELYFKGKGLAEQTCIIVSTRINGYGKIYHINKKYWFGP